MFKLIKNANLYTPKHVGKKDILICGEILAWAISSTDEKKR